MGLKEDLETLMSQEQRLASDISVGRVPPESHDLSTQEVLARADADAEEEGITESDEDKDLSELLREFVEQEKLWHFEGDSGLEKFEKICTAIGYPGHQFRYGDPIQHFLSDNPGAIQAILEWIEEQNIPEWKESVISHLNEKEDNGDSETE